MPIPQRRTVVANITLSLDGRVAGPAGEHDMGWIVPHAIGDGPREHMVQVTAPATTALLGRKNYQGFAGFWPSVADDDSADPRDRTFARWLNAVEKVVFSTTLEEVEWDNARLATEDPAATVKRLRLEEGGDIIVLASTSVIRQLLDADELDRLSITLCPELVGGGARLFTDGPAATSWSLTATRVSDSGAICLLYDRIRAASLTPSGRS
ncbi:dihydrofolate reductase family protein [Allokutzneria oryzae]|uniref:Dihydrofolate reductase family protein n=1 Tax=Allokutzneria oryzae TaxID=1378989 RepID=A0ABV6A750_9PSEU